MVFFAVTIPKMQPNGEPLRPISNNHNKTVTMKKLLFMAVAILLLSACHFNIGKDKAKEVTSVRHSRPFDKIEMKTLCNIKFVQGDTYSIKVVGNESEVKNVTTAFEGTTLKINTQNEIKDFKIGRQHTPTLYITSPDLISVRIEGAGSFEVDKPIDTDTLDIFLKGIGNIEFDKVICDVMHVTLVGTGNVEVNGLTTQRADVLLKGIGNVELDLHNSGVVDCLLQGVGNITLAGEVQRLNKTIQGSGHIDTDELSIQQ